jgi:hypothetical protein
VSSAAHTITGPKSFTSSGTIALVSSTTLSTTIGGIPAGVGYSIRLRSRRRPRMAARRALAAPPSTAHATTLATVRLICHETAQTGSVWLSGVLNTCPMIDAIGSNPGEALVGSTVALTSSSHDADNGPNALSYQWTASS